MLEITGLGVAADAKTAVDSVSLSVRLWHGMALFLHVPCHLPATANRGLQRHAGLEAASWFLRLDLC
jgi:hypothetical protein